MRTVRSALDGHKRSAPPAPEACRSPIPS